MSVETSARHRAARRPANPLSAAGQAFFGSAHRIRRTALVGAASGLAGNIEAEADGVFLCETELVEFFIRINSTGGPVDLWEVRDVDPQALVDNGTGFRYLPGIVATDRIALVREDIAPQLADQAVRRSSRR